MRREPRGMPSTVTRLPLAWEGKQQLGQAGDRGRIEHPREEGHQGNEHECGAHQGTHVRSSRQVQGDEQEVDQLDPDERRHQAARAVDQQVPPQ